MNFNQVTMDMLYRQPIERMIVVTDERNTHTHPQSAVSDLFHITTTMPLYAILCVYIHEHIVSIVNKCTMKNIYVYVMLLIRKTQFTHLICRRVALVTSDTSYELSGVYNQYDLCDSATQALKIDFTGVKSKRDRERVFEKIEDKQKKVYRRDSD